MASAAGPLHHTPRRGKARLRLGIPAVLLTTDGRGPISLLDLSESGARILLASEKGVSCGFLRWMHYEAFCTVVWQDGALAGLQFEYPIDRDWVIDTRDWLPELAKENELRSYAEEWVGTNPATDPPRRIQKQGPQAAVFSQELKARGRRFSGTRRAAAFAWLRSGMPWFIVGALAGIAIGYLSLVF